MRMFGSGSRFYFSLFLGFLLVALCTKPVVAADFKTAYTIEYYINELDTTGYTKAAFTIALTNTKPDLVVKTFTLSFPKSFTIGNILAHDDYGQIVPQVVEKDRTIDVSLTLSQPKAGLNETNHIYLDFLQRNIFRPQGTIWEVYIPTMDGKDVDSQSVTLYLPPGRHSKLSIAKPVPDQITFDKVVWNNVQNRSLYAVFGDSQHYSLNLEYQLSNPNLYRVYTDVAFPPETLYQQIYVDSIAPKPDSVSIDSDGNYLGRYYLNPHEDKTITFTGMAEIFAQPRESFQQKSIELFNAQRTTLFNDQPLWHLTADPPLTNPTMHDLYSYVLNTLQYNFNRVITGNSRMGAQDALRFPDQAVCTEYSDLLVASARREHYYIRELQGFAYEQEQELRPVQTQSDILHSWVEYYDQTKQDWISVDPTWEDTSGIDYFSSLDLNHIVFAIHGKKADYPYPAGSYKLQQGGTFVHVTPSTHTEAARVDLTSTISQAAVPTTTTNTYTTKVRVTNTGNIALWDGHVTIVCPACDNKSQVVPVGDLYPYQSTTLDVSLTLSSVGLVQQIPVTVQFNGRDLQTAQVAIPTFLPSLYKYALPLLLMGGGFVLLFYLMRKRHDH